MEHVERLIARLLLVGVVVSMTTVLLGVILMFSHHPEYLQSAEDLRRLTSPDTAYSRSLGEVASGVLAGRGRDIVLLGLLMLIATPILRVAVALIGFARQGDRAYVVIAAVVLALLAASFLLGRAQ